MNIEATNLLPSEQTSRTQAFLHGWLLIALAAVIAGAALRDFRMVQEFPSMRTVCLVAGLAAGVGIAFCLGGAMHYIDVMLDPERRDRPAWPIRTLLVIERRALMIVQIAAAALALAAIAAVLFNLSIPGPNADVLFRGGYTPLAIDQPA